MLAQKIDTADSQIHLPQVAGTFYPADMIELGAQLRRCLMVARHSTIRHPKLVIAPHAGLIYSGGVAASAFTGLAARQPAIRRVVLIGPAHRYPFKGLALHPASVWRTPMGDVPVDLVFQRRVKPLAGVSVDERPFQGEHALEVLLPLLQASLEKFEIVPLLCGDAAPELVAEALERLWGGPETLIVVSSDLSHFMPEQEAKAHDTGTRRLIETLAYDQITSDRACGHRPVSGALLLARKFDLRVTGIDFATSGDLTNDHTRVVGYGAFAFEYAAQARLGSDERALLMSTAARSLLFAVQNGGNAPQLNLQGQLPLSMSAIRATFVTLEKEHRLRGCIGSLAPHRPLLLDVVANTIKAGFQDPRFPPLQADELLTLNLSISILSHARTIDVASEAQLIEELSPDRDGLVIIDQGRSALFLPHVWAQIPDPKLFLTALKQKAGLPGDHWSPTFRAKRFTVEKFAAPLASLLQNAAPARPAPTS
jgi:AmmeMemoRadiSam system protein B/AmmeMemoRadiSam system protein A